MAGKGTQMSEEDVNRNYFQSYITEDLHTITKNCPKNFIKDFGASMSIGAMKALGNMSDSICQICYPGGKGTGFRVGSKYIMTAQHVVQAILASEYPNVQGSSAIYAALGHCSVYAIFDYLSPDFRRNTSNTFYFRPFVHFMHEKVDTAVLELKTNLVGQELPKAFIYFGTPKFDKNFYIIGPLNGGIKDLDEVTNVVEVTNLVDKDSMETKRDYFDLQKWSREKHNLEYDKDGTLTSPDRFLFHCQSTKGASGAPGVVSHEGVVIVVTMLICGYPDFYYDPAVDDSIKKSISPQLCVEQGASMASVHKFMEEGNPDLCREIFGVYNASIPAPLYTITVSTGKKTKAGTDANVYIVFCGKEKANHKKITILGGDLKIGEKYTLTTVIPFVVTYVELSHDNTGESPDWFCEDITVLCQNRGMEQVFPCRKWLSNTKGDGDIFRIIYEQQAITKEVLREMCKRYGRKSPEVIKACEEIRLQILSWSRSFKDVWATYKPATPDDIVFVVFSEEVSDKSFPQSVKTFEIVHRTINEYSKEDHVTRKAEICLFSEGEEDDRTNLTDILQKNGSTLIDTHSNLNMITASPVKSKQFTLGTHRVKRKPCILFYVCIKGFIPIQEEELPPLLGRYKTDVREGAFIFYNDPEQYMQRLKMGCSIGKKTTEQGLGGTLGAFVDLPNRKIGCISSAHVFFTRDELLQSDGRKQDNHSDQPTIFQPAPTLVPICETNNPFGHILSAVYKKGGKGLTGVEAAVITITDSSRYPDSGKFPMFDTGYTEETQLNYTSGKIYTSLPYNINDYMFYKYGAKTGLTSGEITSDGAIVRTSGSLDVRDECELHNQIEISLVDSTPLAEPGDSGSLVLLAPKDNPNDLRALGIVTGGNTTHQVFYVTPIWEVLRALHLPLTLKKFEGQTPMITDNEEVQVQGRGTSTQEIERNLNDENEIGKVNDKIKNIENEIETVKSKMVEVEGKVDEIRSEMATKTDLNQMASKTDLGQMATKTDLGQMATKTDLEQMASKTDLGQMATKTDLGQMATKTDLGQMATKTDLDHMASKSDFHQMLATNASDMKSLLAQYFIPKNESPNTNEGKHLNNAGVNS